MNINNYSQHSIKNIVGIIHKSVVTPRIKKKFSSSKKRFELRGGGRKPWKQKGTGNARAGSIRSSIWVGGNKAFGPQPNKITKKINQEENQLSILHSLFLKKNHIAISINAIPTNEYLKDDFINGKKNRINYKKRGVSFWRKFTFEPRFFYSISILLIVTKDEYPLLSKKFRPKNINIISVDRLNTHMILKSEFIFSTKRASSIITQKLYEKKIISSRQTYIQI
jgi:hypothetical protein